jgi:hypothetical protein
MDRKKIIQVVVIIIAFGGSGFVLYNGLYRPKAAPDAVNLLSPAAMVAPSPVAQGTGNDLLPYGKGKVSSAFSSDMDGHNFQFDAVFFPTLNTTTEVSQYDDASKTYIQPLIK